MKKLLVVVVLALSLVGCGEGYYGGYYSDDYFSEHDQWERQWRMEALEEDMFRLRTKIEDMERRAEMDDIAESFVY